MPHNELMDGAKFTIESLDNVWANRTRVKFNQTERFERVDFAVRKIFSYNARDELANLINDGQIITYFI